MTRQVPMDQPLSPEDREYLLMRGHDSRVEWHDQNFPADGSPEASEPTDDYDSWKVDELKDEIARRNEEDDAEIEPTGTRKADLIAALREHDSTLEGDDGEPE